MKTVTSVCILLLLLLHGVSAVEPFSWPIKELDTARDISWLSNDEKDIVLEINKLRHNPKQYAIQYIEWMRLYYEGRNLALPNNPLIVHNEGINAFNNLLEELKTTPVCPSVYPSRGMTKATRILVYDQSLTGKTGHTSSGNRDTNFRLSTFGNWYGSSGEILYYGEADPRTMVINMLFDNGNRNKTRRNTLLNPAFQMAGISIGHHKVFQQMCAVNFSTKFVDK